VHYDPASTAFLDETKPSELATELRQILSGRGFPDTTAPENLIAGLGFGNARDELFFAQGGYSIVGFDIRPDARRACARRFRDSGLENQLNVQEDYVRPSGIAENSLVGLNAMSSLHYLSPRDLIGVLRTYQPLLHPEGVAAIGLKTPASSWPTEHRAAGEQPEVVYSLARLVSANLNGEANVPAYRDNDMLRCYYTERQIASVARAAGYEILKTHQRTIPDYDRKGKREHFVFAFLGKGRAA
jgi:hypothetical protein